MDVVGKEEMQFGLQSHPGPESHPDDHDRDLHTSESPPPAGEASSISNGTTTTPADAARPESPVVPRSADGRFGRSKQHVAGGSARRPSDSVQSKFRDVVKKAVMARVQRKGHGAKQELTGSLMRGSPWFFPDDVQKSEVPDRDVHLMTPIYLVCWEFYDADIKAPPCPFCQSSEHVSRED